MARRSKTHGPKKKARHAKKAPHFGRKSLRWGLAAVILLAAFGGVLRKCRQVPHSLPILEAPVGPIRTEGFVRHTLPEATSTAGEVEQLLPPQERPLFTAPKEPLQTPHPPTIAPLPAPMEKPILAKPAPAPTLAPPPKVPRRFMEIQVGSFFNSRDLALDAAERLIRQCGPGASTWRVRLQHRGDGPARVYRVRIGAIEDTQENRDRMARMRQEGLQVNLVKTASPTRP